MDNRKKQGNSGSCYYSFIAVSTREMVRLVWGGEAPVHFFPERFPFSSVNAAPRLLEVGIYTALHLLERRMKFNIMSWLVFSAQICVMYLLVFTAIDTALMYFWNIDSSSKV